MAGVDYAALKKGGFMRQKQKGFFSLRIQVVGGNLTAENIKTVAEVAEKYGKGYVHMTSRQGIEIPFVNFEDIEEVKAELAKEFAKHSFAEWVELLRGNDTCVTPVLNFAEAVNAEQTKANEMVLTVEAEELGEYKQMGFALKLSKTPAVLRKRAPRLGEDTHEFLEKNIHNRDLLHKLFTIDE